MKTVNLIYSPIGIRGKNDKTLKFENDVPFWGYSEKYGPSIEKGDLMFLSYAKESKINYIGRVAYCVKSKYICDSVWSKEKSINTVKNSNKEWYYIAYFDELIKPTNLSKDWLRRSFQYKEKWAGQSVVIKKSIDFPKMLWEIEEKFPKLV